MTNDDPFTLERAWAQLGDLIAMMLTLFGAPAAIAARLILGRDARKHILQWLAPLEAAARRLLLIEALQHPAPNAPAPFFPRGRLASAYADTPAPDLPPDEKDWRVRFNIGLAAAPAKRVAIETDEHSVFFATPRSAPISLNAAPLARRFEALRRLISDRDALVAALARRAHQAPERAARRFAPYRRAARPVQALLSDIQQETDRALVALNSS